MAQQKRLRNLQIQSHAHPLLQLSRRVEGTPQTLKEERCTPGFVSPYNNLQRFGPLKYISLNGNKENDLSPLSVCKIKQKLADKVCTIIIRYRMV